MMHRQSYELSLRTIESGQLDDLNEGKIPLSVPTLDDIILIHGSGDFDTAQLHVDVIDKSREIIIGRSDKTPIQVIDMLARTDDPLFAEPQENLQLYKDNLYDPWQLDIDPRLILDRHGVIDMIEIVAENALGKQLRRSYETYKLANAASTDSHLVLG